MGSGGRRKWVSAMVLSPAAVAGFIVYSNNHPLVNFLRRGSQPATWRRCGQFSRWNKWIWAPWVMAVQMHWYATVHTHWLNCGSASCWLLSDEFLFRISLGWSSDFHKIMFPLGNWPTFNNLLVWGTMTCLPGRFGKKLKGHSSSRAPCRIN